MEKNADAFRTISEVADDLSLPQHVLRFWETRFPQVRPLKRAGGRRYYRPGDISLLKAIRQLLYDDGYTIKGVQRLLKEHGAKGLSADISVAGVDWNRSIEQSCDFDRAITDFQAQAEASDSDVIAEPSGPSFADRGQLNDLVATIDECRRVLDAALKSSR